jgi:23S rRNA pseudouridine2605 synthase
MSAAAIRLNRAIALAGLASRREADALIRRGEVRLNGVVVSEPGTTMVPGADELEVHGRPVQVPTALAPQLWALYKPKRCVSTLHDPEGRPCLAEHLPRARGRLFPIGRLDYDAEGLILLTNDGELANRLAHPSFGVAKTYLATVSGPVPRSVGRQLTSGVELDDGPARAESFRVVQAVPGTVMVEIVLHEGRNHIVRRMFEAVGHPVQALVRTRIGPIVLGQQRPGTVRVIGGAEARALYTDVGL